MVKRYIKDETGNHTLPGLELDLGMGVGITTDHEFVTITLGGKEGFVKLLNRRELDEVIEALQKAREDLVDPKMPEMPDFDAFLKAMLGDLCKE